MAILYLPHTVDVYTSGGSPTLVKAGLKGCFEVLRVEARVRLKDVGTSPLARLWLEWSARDVVLDGRLVFWRERGTWWTVRGLPEVLEGFGQEHIEACLMANTADGLFPASP